MFRARSTTSIFLAVSAFLIWMLPAHAQGTSSDPRDVWVASFTAHVQKFQSYPAGTSASGIVVVRFWINSKGELVTSKIAKSSCVDQLDEEALAIIKRAAPFPVPPPELDLHDGFVQPIKFALRGATVAAPKTDCPNTDDRDKALGLHPPS